MDKTIRMTPYSLLHALRFYFITDHEAPDYSVLEQVRTALAGGATLVQYRNKSFSAPDFNEVVEICNLCKSNQVPFIVNDDIVLAKAVGADGVHVGQTDDAPRIARAILGPGAIIGVSVSTMDEFKNTDLICCDYIGVGPVYPTGTKPDAKSVIGVAGLKTLCQASSVPVVAIGGIDKTNAKDCFLSGAAGIAVISAVSRSNNPRQSAENLAAICGCVTPPELKIPWSDEFALIEKLLLQLPVIPDKPSPLIVPPGDDTALLKSLKRPMITTDTQREGVHFYHSWQSPEEIGQKAVEITLSDLAASYARPLCLFVNLGLPPSVSDTLVEGLFSGMNGALIAHGCHMGGGNIAGAEKLSLDLFAIGEGEALFPLRENARPGYGLFTTGPLGMAKAGLELLMQRQVLDTSPHGTTLIHKFKYPKARFDAARILHDHKVPCVMDISDGLAGDAAHIAKASRVSILLDVDKKNLHPDLIAYCHGDLDLAMDMALAGGEDYELLFACALEVFDQIKINLPEAYPVGKCLPFTGEYILNPPRKRSSFQHGNKAF